MGKGKKKERWGLTRAGTIALTILYTRTCTQAPVIPELSFFLRARCNHLPRPQSLLLSSHLARTSSSPTTKDIAACYLRTPGRMWPCTTANALQTRTRRRVNHHISAYARWRSPHIRAGEVEPLFVGVYTGIRPGKSRRHLCGSRRNTVNASRRISHRTRLHTRSTCP